MNEVNNLVFPLSQHRQSIEKQRETLLVMEKNKAPDGFCKIVLYPIEKGRRRVSDSLKHHNPVLYAIPFLFERFGLFPSIQSQIPLQAFPGKRLDLSPVSSGLSSRSVSGMLLSKAWRLHIS